MKFNIPILTASLIILSSCSDVNSESFEGPYIPENKVMLIMGQDLDTIREYNQSNCCVKPAGLTGYIGLYNILSPEANYGGTGFDENGEIAADADWGSGSSNIYKTSLENPGTPIVIGLSFTENDHPGAIEDLLAGKYDDNIAHLARLIIKMDVPVYLRVGYEFDGAWNSGYENSVAYKAGFRKIVLGLRAAGANNISNIWQASTSPIDDLIEGGKKEDISDWYPGDDVVDWFGTSWFITHDEIATVPSAPSHATQRELVEEVLSIARLKSKPVMISEAAPQGYDLSEETNANIGPILDGTAAGNRTKKTADQIWSEWYAPLFSYIKQNKDIIRGFAYINTNWQTQDLWDAPYEGGYWGDTRLQANEEVTRRWNEEMKNPIWLLGGDDLLDELDNIN